MNADNPTPSLVPRADGHYFDYRNVEGYDVGYATQYYLDRAPCSDAVATYRFFIPRLQKQGPRQSYLELGCGPTLHNTLLMTPYVSRILMTDFLPENLRQVQRWRQKSPEAYSWANYTRLLLELEGRETGAEAVLNREAETREKISEVGHCDLTQTNPIATPGLFDFVGCFHCLEAVARTSEGLDQLIRNVSPLVSPGGVLMIAMLSSTDFYHVTGEDGRPIDVPCLMSDAEMVRQAVERAGFSVQSDDVATTPVDGQADEGICALIHVWCVRLQNAA